MPPTTPTTQRVNSFERRPGIDSENETAQQPDAIRAEDTTAKGRHVLGDKGIEIDTDRVISTEKLDRMKFMHEQLEIFVAEPADEHEPQFIEVNVNGDYRCLVRGETYTLPRYHVAALARAKALRVQQKKVVNNDGSMSFVEQPVIKLSYPFSVLHDPSRRGTDWLKQLLRNQV